MLYVIFKKKNLYQLILKIPKYKYKNINDKYTKKVNKKYKKRKKKLLKTNNGEATSMFFNIFVSQYFASQ